MKTLGKEENLFSDEFLNSIWIFYEGKLSARTKKEYYNVIRGFVKVTGTDPLKINQKDVDIYYNYIENRLQSGRLSYSTALMRFSVMRTLCDYIRYKKQSEGQEYINYFNKIKLPDIDKTLLPEVLPASSDLNGLLKAAKDAGDNTAFLLFSLVIKCGLTSSEISNLDAESLVIDMNHSFCIQFPSRNGLSRIIKLPDDVCELLMAYIDSYHIFKGPLFLNKRGNRMKVRDAERLLKKYVQAGIQKNTIEKPFTLQSMRHAAFKYMLMGGADEKETARYGGITDKWMFRYRRVTRTNLELNAADFSIIRINSGEAHPKNRVPDQN